METQKIITYSAIGVAGIVCLVFLLDLAVGIFGRETSAWTSCSFSGRAFCSGRASRPYSSLR